jgi:large subunit ribosomal protein L5
MARFKEKYLGLKSELQADLGIKNPMQTPKIDKIVISVGAGFAMKDNKLVQNIEDTITRIAGQKASTVIAKKSVAGFKVREGMPVGVMVTLRGERMYQFLSKLVNVVLPRIRDFRGISDAGFDGKGNYNLGLKEQLIFPEVEYDMVTRVRGMNISFVTSATTDHDSKKLLTLLGFPFTNKDKALVLV